MESFIGVRGKNKYSRKIVGKWGFPQSRTGGVQLQLSPWYCVKQLGLDHNSQVGLDHNIQVKYKILQIECSASGWPKSGSTWSFLHSLCFFKQAFSQRSWTCGNVFQSTLILERRVARISWCLLALANWSNPITFHCCLLCLGTVFCCTTQVYGRLVSSDPSDALLLYFWLLYSVLCLKAHCPAQQCTLHCAISWCLLTRLMHCYTLGCYAQCLTAHCTSVWSVGAAWPVWCTVIL